jgi:hypothetical protein
MTRIFLTSVAVLFLATGTAHADTLPKKMLGNRCMRSEDIGRPEAYSDTVHYTRDTREVCVGSDSGINIGRNNFGMQDYGCDFKKINRITKNAYSIHTICTRESTTGTVDMVFHIDNNVEQLVITTVRTRIRSGRKP